MYIPNFKLPAQFEGELREEQTQILENSSKKLISSFKERNGSEKSNSIDFIYVEEGW